MLPNSLRETRYHAEQIPWGVEQRMAECFPGSRDWVSPSGMTNLSSERSVRMIAICFCCFFSQGSILRLCDLVDKVIREEIAQFSTMLSMSLPTTSYIKRPLWGAALLRMCCHISIRNVLKKCIKLFANWLAQGNSSQMVSCVVALP